MLIWNDTLKLLKEKAEVSDSCLVAYSGGKDSLVVMDLCMKTFRNVVPFFMYFVPGLAVIDKQLAYCKERWGKDVLMYPHWLLYRCLKNGIYCDEHFSKDEMPEPTLLDIYTWVRQETGISFLATGAKKSDSSGKSATGVDLSTPSLLWLHDKHPRDFRKLLEFFPFAEAVVQRRKMYGIA